MKKRLLVIFSILIILAVLVVLGSTVFALQTAEVSLYDEDGSQILDTSGIDAADLIKDFVGKSIFFVPESEITASIEARQEYSSWQVVGVEKLFPNGVTIQLTKRVKLFLLSKSGVDYAVDVNGYVVGLAQGDTSRYIDISQMSESVENAAIASTLTWKTEAAAEKFEIIKTMTKTIWQFNYDYDEIYTLLSSYQITEDTLILNTRTGAQIVVMEPTENLHEKMIAAYGVYANKTVDMTGSGAVITVYTDGSVKTTNNN